MRRVQMQLVSVLTVPIQRTTRARDNRAAVESLVQRILDLKAADADADVAALESEIDAIVERLYFGEKPGDRP